MNLKPSFLAGRQLLKCFASLAVTALVMNPSARTSAADPKVAGLLGLAQYSRDGGSYQPLKAGMTLQAGDVVQTATSSALDLDLGAAAGTVRLLQSTTLGLTSVAAGNVLLELKGGEVLGNPPAQPPGSKFRIEVASGIAGILEGEFRLNSRGYLVVLGGKALMVESSETDPKVHSLTGSVYYSPRDSAVMPAPKELERDIRTQRKGRLPK